MIEIYSGQKSRPQDFVARSVIARSHASALKLASLTFKNLMRGGLAASLIIF